jgi:hypothetical protein
LRLRKAKGKISLFKSKTRTFKKVRRPTQNTLNSSFVQVYARSKVSQAVDPPKRAPKLTLRRRTTLSSNQISRARKKRAIKRE